MIGSTQLQAVLQEPDKIQVDINRLKSLRRERELMNSHDTSTDLVAQRAKSFSRVDSIESNCSPGGKKSNFLVSPTSSKVSNSILSKVDLGSGSLVSRDQQNRSPVRGRAYAGVAHGSNHGNVALQ